jgi:hypothetical protein
MSVLKHDSTIVLASSDSVNPLQEVRSRQRAFTWHDLADGMRRERYQMLVGRCVVRATAAALEMVDTARPASAPSRSGR